MKRILLKAVLTVGLISIIFHSVGCSKQNPSNSSEDEVKFSTYSQQERQQYVKKYLYETYGINGSVSEVKQKQINVFANEDDYFATAVTEEGQTISVWVSKYGVITDTVFFLKLQDSIRDYYRSILDMELSNYKLIVYSEYREKPSKIWDEKDNVASLLASEPVYSYIRVIVDSSDKNVSKEYERISRKLNICDATIWFYECENLQKTDVEKLDITSFVYSKTVERDE